MFSGWPVQEVATRDARLTALQRELAAAHLQLATGAGGAAAAGGSDGKVSELEQLNSRLEGEVGRLRGELAAATSAAAAATAAAAVAASTPQPTADSEGLREQLAAAQARLGELEQQAAAAEAGARSRSSSGAGSEETAAKLAVAEQKIQQLMVLAQARLHLSCAFDCLLRHHRVPPLMLLKCWRLLPLPPNMPSPHT